MSLSILDVTNIEAIFYEPNGLIPLGYFTNSIVKESLFYTNSVIDNSFIRSYFTFPQSNIAEFLSSQEFNSNEKIAYTYLYLLTEFNLFDVDFIGSMVYPKKWAFRLNMNNYNPDLLELVRPLYSIEVTPLLPDINRVDSVVYYNQDEVSLSGNLQPEINEMLKVFSKIKKYYDPSDDIYIIEQPTVSNITKANIETAIGGSPDVKYVQGGIIKIEINENPLYILLRNNQADYDYKIHKLIPLLETIQEHFSMLYFNWELWSYALVTNGDDFGNVAKGNVEFSGSTEEININCLFDEIENYVSNQFGGLDISLVDWNTNKAFLDNLRLLYNYTTHQKEVIAPDSTYMAIDPDGLEWVTFFIDDGRPSMLYMTDAEIFDATTAYRDVKYVYGGVIPINNPSLNTQYTTDATTIMTLNALNYTGDVEDVLAYHKHIWGISYNISDYNNSFSVAGTFDYNSEPQGVKKVFSNHAMRDEYPNDLIGHATNNALVNDNGFKYAIVNMTSKYYKLPIPLIKDLLPTENINDATTVLNTYLTKDGTGVFPDDMFNQDFFDYIYVFFNDTFNTVNPQYYISTKKAEEQIRQINQFQLVSTLINTDNTDSIIIEKIKDNITDITSSPLDIFEGISTIDETSVLDDEKSFFIDQNIWKSTIDSTRGVCFMINMNDQTSMTILNETFTVNLMTMQLCKGEKLINSYNTHSIIGRKDKYLYVFYDGTNLITPLIESDFIFSTQIYPEPFTNNNVYYFSDIVKRIVSFDLSDYDEIMSRYRKPGLQDHSLNIHYVNNIYNNSYIFSPFYNDYIMVK